MFKDKKKRKKWIIILALYLACFLIFLFSFIDDSKSVLGCIIVAAIAPIIILWPAIELVAFCWALKSPHKIEIQNPNVYQPINNDWNNPVNQSTWICSCGKANYPETSVCVSCGQQRPLSQNMGYNSIPNNGVTDYAPQLANLKSLFDQGLITEEEYNAKKKQILGL